MGAQESRTLILGQVTNPTGVGQDVLEDLFRKKQYENVGHQLKKQHQNLVEKENAMDDLVHKAYSKGLERGRVEERMDAEKEMRHLDSKWQNKIHEMNKNREAELTTELNSTLDQFSNYRVGLREEKCQQVKALVEACYSKHPSQSLKCSEEVKQFMDCAFKTRLEFLNQAN
eukprot:m.22928 g.22928  ORF g.22928 m.22928 type:complete len:172 (+) comp5497_c1_seq1:26-541(+)